MSIATNAYPDRIVAPISQLPWVDPDTGIPTNTAQQFLQQLHGFLVGINRIIPCNASGTNEIELTVLSPSPQIDAYADFDTYGFIAVANSTGSVTAKLVTADGTFLTLPVYKSNGGTQAGSGDVVSGRQYFLTYVDSLNGASGGFVLR